MTRFSLSLSRTALLAGAAAMLLGVQAHAARPKATTAKTTAGPAPKAKTTTAPTSKGKAKAKTQLAPGVIKLTPKPKGSMSKPPVKMAAKVRKMLTQKAAPPMTKPQLSAATNLTITEHNWAYVTPASMVRYGRAALGMVRPSYISGANNLAVFKGCPKTAMAGSSCKNGGATLAIDAPKADAFVVSCTVRGTEAGAWVIETNDTKKEVEVKPGEYQHLLFVVYAEKAGTYRMRVKSAQKLWGFYGCAVNTAA